MTINIFSRWEERFQSADCSNFILHGLEWNGFVSRVLFEAGQCLHIKKNNSLKSALMNFVMLIFPKLHQMDRTPSGNFSTVLFRRISSLAQIE